MALHRGMARVVDLLRGMSEDCSVLKGAMQFQNREKPFLLPVFWGYITFVSFLEDP